MTRLPCLCVVVLMLFGAYAFGDRVADERAFGLRLAAILRWSERSIVRLDHDA